MDEGGHLPPPGNVVKCFCALVVTAKRSVDKLFMHYFRNLSSASGSFAPRPPRDLSMNPTGGLSSQTPNLPTPGKKILRAPMCIRIVLKIVRDCVLNLLVCFVCVTFL